VPPYGFQTFKARVQGKPSASSPCCPNSLARAASTVAPICSTEVELDDATAAPSCTLPGTMEILATSIPTVKRVPQQCRVGITKTFTKLMRQCSVEATQEQQVRAWKLQFLFFKCVLRMQPAIRGGKKKKLRRNETLRAGLLDRLKRWNDGKVDELWREARKLYDGREARLSTASRAANIRRATECAQDARYGKAVAALLSLGMSPVSEEAIKEMTDKHPDAPKPKLPKGPLPEAVRFESDVVRRKVEGSQQARPLERQAPVPSSSRTCWPAPTKPWARLRCPR
jgi:hypothetical protein